MRRHAIGITAAALAIALTLRTAPAPGATVPIFDLATPLETQLANYIELEGRRRAAPEARVAIVNFTVEFLDSRSVMPIPPAKRSGKKTDDDEPQARIAANVAINLDRSQLQAITDTLYDSAVEDLRASGAEVLTPADAGAATADSALSPMLEAPEERREASDDSGKRTAVLISAHALPALHEPRSSATLSAEATFTRKRGAALLSAHFVVDFLVLRDSDDRMFHKRLMPAFEHNIRANESWYRIVRADGTTEAAILKAPVRAPQSPVARGHAGGYDLDDDVSETSGDDTERLSVNASVYYDQSLRYLGATQDLFIAALGLR